MAKILLRVPEPRTEYEVGNQRQINRSIAELISQLNTTYQQQVKEEQEQVSWFLFQKANRYKNPKVDLTTTNDTVLYTAPAETVTIAKSIRVSNDSSAQDTVSFTITNANDAVFSLAKLASVGALSTEELLSMPLVIDEGEIIKCQATTANRLHVVMSFLEITRD